MKHWIVSLLLAVGSVHAAESVVVYNISQQEISYQQDADLVRSIASITKFMTAMVVLDHNRDLDKKLLLSSRTASHLPKQEYTQQQLLEAMLIHSDNAAAETLAENFPGGRSAFVTVMNWYAQNWGLKNTKFLDPSGLSPFNVSTARELTDLIQIASKYWFIRETSGQRQRSFDIAKGKKTRRINLTHTSGNLFDLGRVVMSKTGLTSAAGWCVGMIVDRSKKEYIVVVLGSKNKAARLATVKTVLSRHVLDN